MKPINKAKIKIKKWLSTIKQQVKPQLVTPNFLVISKAKWRNNSQSPVVLMIDDLTNAWYDHNGNGKMDIGEDWGAGLDKKNSALNFLRKNLLNNFPQIKTVFLVAVGSFQSFSSKVPFTYAEPINKTSESKQFFRKLHLDDKFELGYHGLHHGVLNSSDARFIQEWVSCKSLNDILIKIEQGNQIIRDTVGVNFNGGKYCGYAKNEFSDLSIEKSGFIWWCRDWTPVDIHESVGDEYYDMAFFGKNGNVVSVPANVHGKQWTKAQIKRLLKKGLPISIQEHIAPYKTNGRIQTPNMVDDIEELNQLFTYLRKKPVWYATASEAANYFIARERSLIYDVERNAFKILYDGKVKNPVITLNIDASCICTADKNPFLHIVLPNKAMLAFQNYLPSASKNHFIVNVPVQNGTYYLKAASEAPPTLTVSINSNYELEYSKKNMTGYINTQVDQRKPCLYIDEYGQTQIVKNCGKNRIAFFCSKSASGYQLNPLKE